MKKEVNVTICPIRIGTDQRKPRNVRTGADVIEERKEKVNLEEDRSGKGTQVDEESDEEEKEDDSKGRRRG
ncbi:hypothetical protein RUM43_007500 [Polyplax serrata]|uniref:Uncharacterized protein n=1 Tax=Polyplax serrata TaxID=468196 RepID=A0AAN8P8M1_POLSC